MLTLFCAMSLGIGFLVAGSVMREFAVEGNMSREIAIFWTLVGVFWPVLLALALLALAVMMILALVTSVPASREGEPE